MLNCQSNGSKIPVVDKCSLTIDHKNKSYKASFIVVDSDSLPIVGLKTSEYLHLIKKFVELKQIVKSFSQNFMIVSEKYGL